MKIKNLSLVLAALCGFFIAQNAQATCANYATYADGQVLTSSSLNSLQTNYTDCVNGVLNGDTFTGNIEMHSGADLNIYSDTGSTLKASIDGATGSATIANRSAPFFSNITLVNATTTTANDTIRIRCGSASCSATNPGLVVLQSATVGDITTFPVTADVDLKISGAQWMIGGTDNDVTGAIVKVFAANDNGSLRFCAGYLSGRNSFLTTDTTSTQTNVDSPEELYCNTAVGSASNTVADLGWVRANFTFSTKVWALQTGVNDINLGSADGYWQPFKSLFTGFSAPPTSGTLRWTQHDRLITVAVFGQTSGTSNATTFTQTAPVKNAFTSAQNAISFYVDNGANVLSTGVAIIASAGTQTITMNASGGASGWTNANGKQASFTLTYEAGPVASFPE